jgi:hypothetical protein
MVLGTKERPGRFCMKKIFCITSTVFIILLFFSACQMDTTLEAPDEAGVSSVLGESAGEEEVPMNPDPAQIGSPPAATVPLLKPGAPEKSVAVKSAPSTLSEETVSASLSPEVLTARLKAGESVTEHKTAFMPADVRPPMGDILISFDLTGSMTYELNNVRTNAQNIMTAVRGEIPDSNFGVVSHMDYPGTFTSGEVSTPQYYYNLYGGSSDYPYSLDQPLTDNTSLVVAALNDLNLGYGADIPEDYSRVFYESYADPAVGWREGARKIMLAWLDSVPHDPDFAEIYNPDLDRSTGVDPGRDAIAGTEDDLEILTVLSGMAANDITLIVVYSHPDTPPSTNPDISMGGDYWGTGFPLWEAYTALTGGSAFKIDPDGTIPGDIAIDEFVAGLIGEQIGHIDNLTLEVSDPAYAGWLTSVSPASYLGIDLEEDTTLGFDITLTVPSGTATGTYDFTVALVGDGVTYAEQAVSIEVYDEIEVSLDVKPGSCPNPFNVYSKGVLPAAVAGTGSFDVTQIDPALIRLNGVAPLRWNFEDVTAPYEPYTDKPLDENACALSGPDGYMDLTLKFDTEEMAASLGTVEDGEVLALELTGELFDGTPIVGEDIIRIISKKKK